MACESHPRPPGPMRWRNRRLSDSLVFQQSDLPDFSPQALSIIRLGDGMDGMTSHPCNYLQYTALQQLCLLTQVQRRADFEMAMLLCRPCAEPSICRTSSLCRVARPWSVSVRTSAC
jgi:hypothetical protein